MPNTTKNYGLKKPLPEEFYDVSVQNENMDIIDAELKTVVPAKADIDFYVTPDGNDSTGDGTEAKPFRQIQKAIDSLPKNLGGKTIRIHIASGEYVSVNVEGFYGGNQSGGANLRINSDGTDGVIINGYVRVRGCDVQVSFGKATLRGSAVGYDVIAYGCKYVSFVGLICSDTSSKKGIVVDTCSYVMVNGCTLSNKEIALEAYGSMVMTHSLKGTNNAYGIKSGNSDAGLASLVYVAYRAITATTLYTKANGGLIFENGNEIDAIKKSGDTMTGTLTVPQAVIDDNILKGLIMAEGTSAKLQIIAQEKSSNRHGMLIVSPNGLYFLNEDGYEYPVYHQGNAPATIATAELV